jgi:hypothetical protein
MLNTTPDDTVKIRFESPPLRVTALPFAKMVVLEAMLTVPVRVIEQVLVKFIMPPPARAARNA